MLSIIGLLAGGFLLIFTPISMGMSLFMPMRTRDKIKLFFRHQSRRLLGELYFLFHIHLLDLAIHHLGLISGYFAEYMA